MRKVTLFLLIVAIIISCQLSALALDPMGPPVAGLKKGQYKAGAEYSDTRMDLGLNGGWITSSIYDRSTNVFQSSTSGVSSNMKIKNLKMHKAYANLGYGIADNWEMFLRLGGMNTEFSGDFFHSSPQTYKKYNGDTGFAIGFGTKVTFYDDKDKLKLGGLFQMSWAKSCAKARASNYSSNIELNIVEMQIALGAEYKLRENFWIYGGPFWHYMNFGDSDLSGTRRTDDIPQDEYKISTMSYDVEQISCFGGYVGGRMEVLKNTFFTIEYQHTASADALAMSLYWPF